MIEESIMTEETPKPKKKYYDYISVGNRTKQVVYFVEQHDKPVHFDLLLKNNTYTNMVVICKSKKTADELASYLDDKDIKASIIHGNHRKEQSEKIALAFNDNEIDILITTDMILHTLELKNIKTVLNYDLPFAFESYFKTLRYVDEVGESISFVNIDDEGMLDTIEFVMKYDIPRKELEEFEHTPLPKVVKAKKKKPRHKKYKKVRKDNEIATKNI